MFVNSISYYNYKSNNFNKAKKEPSFGHLTLSPKQYKNIVNYLNTDKNSAQMNSFNTIFHKFSHSPINLKQQLNARELKKRVMEHHDLEYLSDKEIMTCCKSVLSRFLRLIGKEEAKDYNISVTLSPNYTIMGSLCEKHNIYNGFRIVEPCKVQSVEGIAVAKSNYSSGEVEDYLMQEHAYFRPKEGYPDHIKVPLKPNVIENKVVNTMYADLEEAVNSILELKNLEREKVGAPKVRLKKTPLQQTSDGQRYIPGVSSDLLF